MCATSIEPIPMSVHELYLKLTCTTCVITCTVITNGMMCWCSQAKNAEAQRKKQLQTVVKMQTDLEQLQRVNARKLKVRVHADCVGK